MMIPKGELIFIDTNILLSATDSSRISNKAAVSLLNNILKAGYNPVTCGQVIREYLVVATRPREANGLGMLPGDAVYNIKQFEKKIVIYDEKRSSSEILQHLVTKHELKGKRIHDANIAAVMQTYGISRIITDNPSDFEFFKELTLISSSEAAEVFI